MANEQEDAILQTSDVARILGVSRQYVIILADTGKVPVAGRTANGTRLFTRSGIEGVRLERLANPPRRGRRMHQEAA